MTWTRVVVIEMGEVIRSGSISKEGHRCHVQSQWEIRDTDLVLWHLSQGCVTDLTETESLQMSRLGQLPKFRVIFLLLHLRCQLMMSEWAGGQKRVARAAKIWAGRKDLGASA